MKLNKWVLQCIFFLLCSQIALAQAINEKQALKTVLQKLEERYNVSFEYVDETIVDIFLNSPSEITALSDVLQYLRQNTGLVFLQLDQRFVTISKSKSSNFNICGILKDNQDGERIVGATIQVGNKFTISDAQGSFQLSSLSENNQVIIQSLGYQTLKISVQSLSQLPCKVISITPEILTLPGVVVSDYITQGIYKKVDGSFTINSEKLGILPGLIDPDVLLTIQALPGIQSVDETVSNINVRGGTHDQNLVLWEGIKMYQSGYFFGLISVFNPYLTKEVTLINNGTTAFYNDGVSSTIDIRSDDQVAKEFTGGMGINWINADIHSHIPLSAKASLQMSARHSIANFIQTPTYDQYFERAFGGTEVLINGGDTLVNTGENFKFYDINLKLLYDISHKDKLRINFLHVYNDIEYQENASVDSLIESKTSGLEQKSLAGSISYKRLWSEKVSTSAQLYISSYDLKAVNFDIFNDQRLIQDNEVLDTGLKLDAQLELNVNASLIGGYQFFEVGISNLEDINNPSYRRLFKNVIRSHAVFTEVNINSKSNQTNFRAGVRGNYLEKFDEFIFEPRFSFNQKLSDKFSLVVLGETKSQSTTQVIDFQNDFLGIEKRRWILSDNDSIPIVKNKQISVGLNYVNRNLVVSLEGYYKKVQGITTASQGFQNQLQFVRSSGDYEVTGIDFLVNKQFNKINAWLSYSYADNTYEFKELIPPKFPNNLDITHTVVLGCSYQSNGLKLSAGANWHTGRPTTEPVDIDEQTIGDINYNLPNSSRLDDYMRIDLSATYEFRLSNKMQATVGASVWNLMDKENIVDNYYQINDNNQPQALQQKSLGRTANLMFRVSF